MPRRFHSSAAQLITQSIDAALTAVQVFNNPLVKFKSETFIVLMNIAWLYLLHAHYKRARVDYRYYRKVGNLWHFEHTDTGTYKYRDLNKCLDAQECPLDTPTKKNLLFLIGLRDEISHHVSPIVDQFASARYEACCLNYNRCLKELFGGRHGIDRHLSYSLQFQMLSRQQLTSPNGGDLPPNIRSYIAKFDAELSVDDLYSDRFAYRRLFVPKLVGKPDQAAEVIEFLKPSSELAQAINRDYVAFKEVERPKFRPSDVVRMMKEEGYPRFRLHWHTGHWHELQAKNPAKGLGVDVAGSWYWYSSWVDTVRTHCDEHADRYH